MTTMAENPSKPYDYLKRLIDVILAGGALLVLSWLLLILTVFIKLSSTGPVFFFQERVGRKRKIFRMVKFRTMVVDAPKLGAAVTTKHDPRITSIGRILRRTKLDELPELWNVFIGDMSLVGPRPEVPKYVNLYSMDWEKVFDVRPGVTDIATLQFRDEESVLAEAIDHESAYIKVVMAIKMEMALDYVQRRSFWLDVKILFLTVWGITLGRFFMHPSKEQTERAIAEILVLNRSNGHPN